MARSINVSVLAVASFLHANCGQAVGEILGNKELRWDNHFTGLVDISKLSTLRKTPWKIGFIVFEQMKRVQGSVITSERSRRTGNFAPKMDSRQSFVKFAGRLKMGFDHHSPRRVDVSPLATDPDRG